MLPPLKVHFKQLALWLLSACQLASQAVSHVCFIRRQHLFFWSVGEESAPASLRVAIMFVADQAVPVSFWEVSVYMGVSGDVASLQSTVSSSQRHGSLVPASLLCKLSVTFVLFVGST